jgi:nicotinic acid mononucleotide adenylyltransferase
MAQNVGRGTRTPQMLEYERQAEERAKEQEAMAEERERMMEAEAKMQQEIERIAQEEYEMKQYYEAEALRHAEEIRAHQEGVYFLIPLGLWLGKYRLEPNVPFGPIY